jgi:hypothetical protein
LFADVRFRLGSAVLADGGCSNSNCFISGDDAPAPIIVADTCNGAIW